MRCTTAKVSFLTIVLALGACSAFSGPPTPDFYPNKKYLDSPRSVVNEDEQACLAMANEYIKQPNKYQTLAKDAVVGGAVGAAGGAIGGAIMGHAGPATGAGAAIGGLLGVLKGLSDMNEPTPSYERFVEHCLQQKGYAIIGWSSK
ncbi:MAG: hypothetical protein J0M12_03505 [Deltaproteobacteria bacterium]|nr:hypothetical protein [Deltaproteobacteria bacterium]